MSLRLLETVKSFKIKHKPQEQLELRIGIHTGNYYYYYKDAFGLIKLISFICDGKTL